MGRVYEYECDVTDCGATAKSKQEFALPKGWKEVRVTEGTGNKEDTIEPIVPVTICPKHKIKYTV